MDNGYLQILIKLMFSQVAAYHEGMRQMSEKQFLIINCLMQKRLNSGLVELRLFCIKLISTYHIIFIQHIVNTVKPPKAWPCFL